MPIPRIHKYCQGVEPPTVGWDICDRCIRKREIKDVPIGRAVFEPSPIDAEGRCVAFLGFLGSLADRWGTRDFFGNEIANL